MFVAVCMVIISNIFLYIVSSVAWSIRVGG